MHVTCMTPGRATAAAASSDFSHLLRTDQRIRLLTRLLPDLTNFCPLLLRAERTVGAHRFLLRTRTLHDLPPLLHYRRRNSCLLHAAPAPSAAGLRTRGGRGPFRRD